MTLSVLYFPGLHPGKFSRLGGVIIDRVWGRFTDSEHERGATLQYFIFDHYITFVKATVMNNCAFTRSLLGRIYRSHNPLRELWHSSEGMYCIVLGCAAYLVERTSLVAALRQAGCPSSQVEELLYPRGELHRLRVVLRMFLVLLRSLILDYEETYLVRHELLSWARGLGYLQWCPMATVFTGLFI